MRTDDRPRVTAEHTLRIPLDEVKRLLREAYPDIPAPTLGEFSPTIALVPGACVVTWSTDKMADYPVRHRPAERWTNSELGEPKP